MKVVFPKKEGLAHFWLTKILPLYLIFFGGILAGYRYGRYKLSEECTGLGLCAAAHIMGLRPGQCEDK